jgi:hypothetical protein
MLRPEDLESAGLTPGVCVGGPLDGDPLVARAADDVRALWALRPGRCFLLAPLDASPANGAARRLGVYRFEPDVRIWTWIPDT